ncbi:aminotransferase class III-fold pyridoxal phosphate-dependent enzyme [Bosea sp. 117]|uniref:aminotransferase class III-fold pyridoxal phosphate-dependent enzyme n=1 Tax=Bosea sp. 117 TaxID=1125973 RepID=UPI00068AEECD|nr:aminotransferase class III-fold pyridoxal phosphate-dependent enzyme [Bosea sp. 117]
MNVAIRGANHPGNLAMLPFSNLQKLREERPLMFVRGKGIYTFDEHGRDYIEAVSTFYCVNLGFSDEELVEAAVEQLRALPMYPSGIHRTVPVVMELAERLAEVSPVRGGHVMFATTGSEANDQLVKFTWYANRVAGEPRRRKIISRRASYHGGTIATTALGGSPGLQEAFGIPTGDSLFVSHPTWPIGALPGETEEAYADRLVDELRQVIEEAGPETVAAFIAEPVSVSSGMFPPPKGYFQKIKALLDGYGIRLYADEVVTGFGRTGKMWGSEALGIEPDCISCAKGLSGAYQPISAVVMSDAFYGHLEDGSNAAGIFNHGSTYGGHPVSAAVALKVLDIYERRNILGHVQSIMPVWQKALAGLEDHPLVTATRCFGLAGAVQIAPPGERGPAAASPSLAPGGLSQTLYEAGLAAGVVVRPLQGCVVLSPPLIITEAEIGELARRLRLALDATLSTLPR